MIARYSSLRVFAYFMAVTVFFAIASQLAKSRGGLTVFEEHGFAEQVQFGCVVFSGVLLLTLSRMHARVRGVLALAGALGLFAATRELNNTELYRKIFFFGAASWVAGGIVFGFLLWRFHRGLLNQIDTLLRQPGASLMAGGFVIVVGWAQVFAQKTIFESREADRIVEEGLESAGYFLILFGVMELFFNLRKAIADDRVR